MPELRIEGLVHGGETLAHLDGRVVFVRGGAPGDVVEAQVTADEKSFLRARVLRVIAPGAARVEAPCPIVLRCGGCPAQQISAEVQLAEKSRLVQDALVRTGGLLRDSFELLPIVPSPSALRYRRRARLHRGPRGSWGFSGVSSQAECEEGEEGARAGREIVPVDVCLLFEPALQELYARTLGALETLGGLQGVSDLGLDVSSTGAGAIDLHTEGTPPAALRKKAEALLAKVKGLKGITLGPFGGVQLLGQPVLVDGAPATSAATGPRARLRSRPDLFAQANRAGVPLMQELVLEMLGSAAKGRVLELFCGAGTLTLPLLEAGARVLGVESVGPSLQLLRTSADEAGLSERLRIVAGDAAKVTQQLARDQERFDAVLLDPPRTGAAEAVKALATLGAKRVVYVSCEVTTLARDARLLAERGFRLRRARPIDLFPQTAHVEVVALFEVG